MPGIDSLVFMVSVVAAVAAAAGLYNIVRPALGSHVLWTGATIHVRAGHIDPSQIRARLWWRVVLHALPATVTGLLVIAMATPAIPTRLGLEQSPLTTVFEPSILMGLGIAVLVGSGSAVVLAHAVSKQQAPGGFVSNALFWPAALSALPALMWVWWAVAASGWSLAPVTFASVATLWAVSAVLIFDELRVVAIWDGMCHARHMNRQETPLVHT